MPSYYSNGLPPDLDAKVTSSRLRAALDFDDAKRSQPPITVRRLLIERRIMPELVAFVAVACEMAKRGWLPIGAVEQEVRNYQHTLARSLCPDTMTNSGWDETFQREVRQKVESSAEWRECRVRMAETAEALIAEHSTRVPATQFSFDYAAADLESEVGRRAAVDAFIVWCGQVTSEPLNQKHFAHAMGHTSSRQLQYWMSAKPGEKATRATDERVRRVLRMSRSEFVASLKRRS